MPMDPATIIIDLLLTALIYGVGPIAFLLFRKHPLSTRNLKTFHVAYTVVIALLFAVGNSLAGNRISFSPALIWGLIFYNICKSQFEKRDLLDIECGEDPKQPEMFATQEQPIHVETPTKNAAAPQPEPAPVVCTYQSDFEIKEPPAPSVAAEAQTETPVAKKHAGKPLKWSVVALAVLLAVSIAGNIYQAVDATNNQREVSELQSELEKQKRAVTTLRTGKDQLAKQVQSLKDEIAELEDYNDFATEYAIAGLFMYDSIGFIVSGSRYYHRYDCPVFQDADSYWAHNIEYCAGQGYSRHSACWED